MDIRAYRGGGRRPPSAPDRIIAAVAGSNDCVVVTDNEQDFMALSVFNPLRERS
jgi:predicted nucleic acid-binding protein